MKKKDNVAEDMTPPVPDINTLLQSGGESYVAYSSSAALLDTCLQTFLLLH